MPSVEDALEEGIGEEIRRAIAEEAVATAIDIMESMVGNAGQEALISEAEDDFDQVDDIMEGDFDPVDSNHPEAVSEITEVGNQICQEAAEVCAIIKEAEEALG